MRYAFRLAAIVAVATLIGLVVHHLIRSWRPAHRRAAWTDEYLAHYQPNGHARSLSPAQCAAVLTKARSLVSPAIHYDPAYAKIGFPNGDVPADRGVCADVIVRAFRAEGHDLQALLNADMHSSFGAYPTLWHLSAPDPNIDHRRVPNLMTWFTRYGAVLPLTERAADYKPCDVIAWDLGGGITHIGLVSDKVINGTPAIIHHIGGHPTEEDVLFSFKMIGHFAL